jgi:hypothetical protein
MDHTKDICTRKANLTGRAKFDGVN